MSHDRWGVHVDDDGWAGDIVVDSHRTITWDGTPLPVVTWHIPLYRAEALAEALELLDELADVAGALGTSVERPYGWAEESAALRKGLQHLADVGRAHWHTDGHITAGPPQEAPVGP